MRRFDKKQPIDHPWDLAPNDAITLQQRLSHLIVRRSNLKKVATVAGVDSGYKSGVARGAVVVLKYPTLETVDQSFAEQRVSFPYIPGLLSFREGPVILAALHKLKVRPDLLIFDGQGIAHPRRFGIASHIGLLTAIPSIGCAKKKLIGCFDTLASKRGSSALLMDKGEVIGAVVRTRNNVTPVFVSIGHRVNLQDSIRYVLSCCRGFRLPETTRRADRLAAFPD
jgi:deoxyribonuclease V